MHLKWNLHLPIFRFVHHNVPASVRRYILMLLMVLVLLLLMMNSVTRYLSVTNTIRIVLIMMLVRRCEKWDVFPIHYRCCGCWRRHLRARRKSVFIFMRARESRCSQITEHAIDAVNFVGLICFQVVLVQSEVSNPKNILYK